MVLLSSKSLLNCRIIATGGKGGVGKTTTAAALALH
ncbi:MAG: ArsA-related P-loop ATPase, partial [Promethearchaeota archaeon]